MSDISFLFPHLVPNAVVSEVALERDAKPAAPSTLNVALS